MRFENLIGQKFGRLTVIERAENKNGRSAWLCLCECGNTKITISRSLKDGTTQSCGCYQLDRVKESNFKHGLSGKKKCKLYSVWHSMKDRCYNKNHKYFRDYGGRGINICKEWKNDFQAFYDWAISSGYKVEKNKNKNRWTIDRIDNNKGYYPENCRFVTMKEQARNKRNSLKENERFVPCPICGKVYRKRNRQEPKTCSSECALKLWRYERYGY